MQKSKDTAWEVFSACVKAKFFYMREFFKTCFKYYRDPLFWHIDTNILWEYFWMSPYKICRELTLGSYGETPFSVWHGIVSLAHITKEDHVLELGSGRGRGCFWLKQFVGCKVHGIEIIPYFVKTANRIKDKWHVEDVKFTCEDMFQANIQDYSVVYIFASDFSDEDIEALTKKFEGLKKGTKIVTISYSLLEVYKSPKIALQGEKVVLFPWGETSAYLHEVV